MDNKNEMTEILSSTIKFINSDKYIKGTYSYDGKFCSIGRYLISDDLEYLNTLIGGMSKKISTIYPMLHTQKIRDLPLSFWKDIQALNDALSGWRKQLIEQITHNIEDGIYVK